MTIASGSGGLHRRPRTNRSAATADATSQRTLPGIVAATVTTIAAGAIHATATGIHAEHPQLARVFVAMSVLQRGAGLWALARPNVAAAGAIGIVNLAAVVGWLATRLTGISWIEGLEAAESPQFADTVCALLGALAVGGSLSAVLLGWQNRRPTKLFLPSLAIAALAIPAMVTGGTHVHSHAASSAAEGAHDHGEEAATAIDSGAGASGAVPVVDAPGHDHGEDATPAGVETDDSNGTATTVAADETHTHDDDTDDGSDGHAHTEDPVVDAVWPRRYDPDLPLDIARVPGVSAIQEARATRLVEKTLVDLPSFADIATIEAMGFVSIGDGITGFEHFMNRAFIDDDTFLDPAAPESVVFQVDRATGTKTLVSAMFLAPTGTPLDDPLLTEFAGPLMTWHVHSNLCWAPDDSGKNVIVGLTDANGVCARGTKGSAANPMVHVWITPQECGPFAALEGVGAGDAAVTQAERVDMCRPDHGDAGHSGHDGGQTAAAAIPYDPTRPIDLGGVDGVTLEQQAAAENLVAITVVRLPQWSDYRVAEAAGFHSIGDASTGTEHFIQWDWIDDDVFLDPDHPESLVYQPQPDGSKRLVSAMYMLASTVALTDVPDIGGALMQWHIHDNLCFTIDPVAPRVAGITTSGGTCAVGLKTFVPSPMIHVWIVPNRCGPFAALEGIGAGAIAEGEERLCDHVHGDGLL